MALTSYNQKRSKKETPEPFGGKPDSNALQFVIQKHAASHLHYDFRLEMRGILKSWAVPKGPSMNPEIKHLAMLVEDHPYDYKDFEGIIPKGQYGGGTVIVWDRGTYEPLEKASSKAEQEKIMQKEFHSGSIKIRMHGKKLKGEFALVKTKGRGENSWLLIKHRDAQATTDDITLKDKSVISKMTIDQMANNRKAKEWNSNRGRDERSDKLASPKGAKPKPVTEIAKPASKGKKIAMPKSVAPMLCTLTKEPVDDSEYLFELKWDGYRIIAYINKGKVRMDSRSALDYTKKYPVIADALKTLKHDIVVDGEVVVFNTEGLPDFDALQLYNGHDSPISYCIFDLLWLDGYSLMHLPLTERKERLRELLGDNDILRFSESFDDGPELYQQSIERNLEGIVAKQKNSQYVPGERGNAWLKTPTRKRQEFVIGGWAESDKVRSFKSLVFGAYNEGKLEWIGRSGGGYKQKDMPEILEKLQSLEIEESPFVNKVLDTKGSKMHWVKPQLVANFEFATWTKSGRIRKPATFLGFRKDKKATQVVREIPKSVAVIEKQVEEEANEKPETTKSKASATNGWDAIDQQKNTDEQDFQIGDCTIKISDVDRTIWKGITKADLITYYHKISKVILPYLKDRPQSLHVKPINARAPGFYIKDMEGREPGCADIFADTRRHAKQGKRSKIDYLVCNNESTLLWMINLGCIDLNPWNSRTISVEQPDYITIDLDPSGEENDVDLKKLLTTALAAKSFFDDQKIKAFCKTSGKTGLHFFVPCKDLSTKEASSIAEHICTSIQSLVPNDATSTNSISSRKGKVYVDPSQNDYADTLASAYSVRPFHLPTVSTPLDWKEINLKLDPAAFTMDKILKRIASKGDLFKGLFDTKNISPNVKVLRALQ